MDATLLPWTRTVGLCSSNKLWYQAFTNTLPHLSEIWAAQQRGDRFHAPPGYDVNVATYILTGFTGYPFVTATE
jgi:hypothetical protein